MPVDALDNILGTAVSGTWRLRLIDMDFDPRGVLYDKVDFGQLAMNVKLMMLGVLIPT